MVQSFNLLHVLVSAALITRSSSFRPATVKISRSEFEQLRITQQSKQRRPFMAFSDDDVSDEKLTQSPFVCRSIRVTHM
jgi:hypothetical protein